MRMVIERFAPSPTGLLHIGHAYSAALGWRAAHRAGGRFLLRMEDLDASRCRPEFYSAIEEDLTWLGLDWSGPVLRQSDRVDAYDEALARLDRMGLLYPCVCTRKDLQAAISAPQAGAEDPDPVYPGICKGKPIDPSRIHALRLDMQKAIEFCGGDEAINGLSFVSCAPDGDSTRHRLSATFLLDRMGDVVLRRKDSVAAYHLAVVVDDAFQHVTHVTRGEDLFEVTQIHRLLQHLLDLPVPAYHHHALICDPQGKRLAKRDDARSIRSLRLEGHSPQDVLAMVGLSGPDLATVS